jgi:hypothetical protein
MSSTPVNVNLDSQIAAFKQLLANEAGHNNPGLAYLKGQEPLLASQLLALVAHGEGYILPRDFDKHPITGAPELNALLSEKNTHAPSIKETVSLLAKGLSRELTQTAPHHQPDKIVGSATGLGIIQSNYRGLSS